MKQCSICLYGPMFSPTKMKCATCADGSNWSGKETPGPVKRSKYHREIKPGVWVDVYDVLHAFEVTNQANGHAIKKLLAPGKRGHKSTTQDMEEAILSIQRAIELEE